MDYAVKIRATRESMGMNQSQFARHVGLTQAAISQFEAGTRIPATTSIEQIQVNTGIQIFPVVKDYCAIKPVYRVITTIGA